MHTNKQRKIRTKFLLIIAGCVIILSAVIVYWSWSYSNSQIEQLLVDKSKLALQFDLAIREYVAESVRPFAEEHVGQDKFDPKVMSTSFVARSIFGRAS